jgi:hypothetical protein
VRGVVVQVLVKKDLPSVLVRVEYALRSALSVISRGVIWTPALRSSRGMVCEGVVLAPRVDGLRSVSNTALVLLT